MLAGTSPVLLLYQHQQPLISPDTMTDDADADDAASKRLMVTMQAAQESLWRCSLAHFALVTILGFTIFIYEKYYQHLYVQYTPSVFLLSVCI